MYLFPKTQGASLVFERKQRDSSAYVCVSCSARCPVAKGSGLVTSAAETSTEEWQTNPTASTCPAPPSSPPASALVGNGMLESGHL